MDGLYTFLEGLLDKSNKASVLGAKDLVLSLIEDRINDQKSDFDKRMKKVLKAIKATYKPFTAPKIKPSQTPQCFIKVYYDSSRHISSFSFVWVQTKSKSSYWRIGWELESRDQRNDGLILFINNLKTYRLDDTLGYGTEVYEVPEGDMKDYFRAIDKYRPDSYYYSDADIEKIEQVIN